MPPSDPSRAGDLSSPTSSPARTVGDDEISSTLIDQVRSALSAAPLRIHIVGIGGTGMSAIAVILHEMGHVVTGSDQSMSPGAMGLMDLGIDVQIGHGQLPVSAPMFVARSTAVSDDNPEIVAARALAIPVLRRAELLAAISALRFTLAVSGTHGKTTSSGMLATALVACDPGSSFLVGSPVANLGAAAAWEQGTYFAVEADESDRTHCALSRAGALITNIEPEHLDRYGTAGAVVDGFIEFVEGVSEVSVMCADDAGCSLISNFLLRNSGRSASKIVTYGFTESADYRVSDLRLHVDSSTFALTTPDSGRFDVRLGVMGRHNVSNAAGVLSLVHSLGLDLATAIAALDNFRGTARRFENKGEVDGIVFIDDYAHHPTELEATLSAARQLGRRVVAVFQPHLYSRTAANASGFGEALCAADQIIVTDVYGAREKPVVGVTGALVSDAAIAFGARPENVAYVSGRRDVASVVARIVRSGDVCISLGAGDITSLADEVQAVLASGDDGLTKRSSGD